MSFMDHFQLWIEAYITLAIFSFLYKDNRFYRVVESIFAGLSVGYYIGLYWKAYIVQPLWVPMMQADDPKWWLVFPGLIGLTMFARLWPKYNWVSRVGLAFVMGSTAGIFLIAQLHGLVLPHMQKTMLALVSMNGFGDSIFSLIVIVGVISTLIYFYFSKPHTGALGVTAKVGIWFIMISFGAHFGYTVMGRVSLLIGRAQFLIDDWLGTYF